MARKMTEWPSKRGPITKIMPSDGCIGGYSSLGGGKVARIPRIWMAYGECRFNVLPQKRLIEMSRLNETNIQNQLNLEDERVQRGSGIAVDVLQAKSRLQLAKERRVNFEGALENAVSTYIQVFDHAPEISEMLDPLPPLEILPASLEEALETALKNNPALTSTSATSEVAREHRRSVFAQFFPTIDLVSNWTYEKNKAAVIGTSREYSMLLQANWDLFTGLSTRDTLAQAAFDYGADQG